MFARPLPPEEARGMIMHRGGAGPSDTLPVQSGAIPEHGPD